MHSLMEDHELWFQVDDQGETAPAPRRHLTHRLLSRAAPGGGQLVLNLLSGAVDLLADEEWFAVAAARAAGNFDDLCPALRAALVRRGYLFYDEDDADQALEAICQAYREPFQPEKSGVIPTASCNFRCRYCFEPMSLRRQQDHMSPAQLAAALAGIDRRAMDCDGGHLVEIFGGEPLQPRNRGLIEQILSNAAAAGHQLSLITNGYHLAEFAELLRPDVGVGLTVTLDGTAETHDRRRLHEDGVPTFEAIVRGLERVIPLPHVQVIIRQNMDREVAETLGAFLGWIKHKGWHRRPNVSFQLSGLFDCYDSRRELEISVSPLEVHELFLRHVASDPELSAGRFDTTCYSPEASYLASVFDYHAPGIHTRSDRFTPKIAYCPAVDSAQRVYHADGRIYNCLNLAGGQQFAVGSYGPEGETLYPDQLDRWRRRTIPNLSSECRACRLVTLCAGGCAAARMWRDGELYARTCDLQLKEQLLERYLDAFMAHKLPELVARARPHEDTDGAVFCSRSAA